MPDGVTKGRHSALGWVNNLLDTIEKLSPGGIVAIGVVPQPRGLIFYPQPGTLVVKGVQNLADAFTLANLGVDGSTGNPSRSTSCRTLASINLRAAARNRA